MAKAGAVRRRRRIGTVMADGDRPRVTRRGQREQLLVRERPVDQPRGVVALGQLGDAGLERDLDVPPARRARSGYG